MPLARVDIRPFDVDFRGDFFLFQFATCGCGCSYGGGVFELCAC